MVQFIYVLWSNHRADPVVAFFQYRINLMLQTIYQLINSKILKFNRLLFAKHGQSHHCVPAVD